MIFFKPWGTLSNHGRVHAQTDPDPIAMMVIRVNLQLRSDKELPRGELTLNIL